MVGGGGARGRSAGRPGEVGEGMGTAVDSALGEMGRSTLSGWWTRVFDFFVREGRLGTSSSVLGLVSLLSKWVSSTWRVFLS